jgi:hypothetical protein
MSQLKVINKEMTSDIKVVISDNNSTDIEGYKNIEKYCIDNNLTYSRNATNLLADTNIVRLLSIQYFSIFRIGIKKNFSRVHLKIQMELA